MMYNRGIFGSFPSVFVACFRMVFEVKFKGGIKMSSNRRMAAAVKICSSFLAAVLLIAVPNMTVSVNNSASGSSGIDDLQAQIDKIKKENEARKQQIAGLTGDINKNKESINLISAQIDGVNLEIQKYGELIISQKESIEEKKLEIEAVEAEVENKELEIENKKAYIAELEEQNKKNLERFAELARVLYMNDISDTIPILSGSDDWYEYFVYSDVIKNISDQNVKFMKQLLADINDQEDLIEELNGEIAALEREKEELSKEKEKLEEDMKALEASKADLDSYAAQQKAYLGQLSAQNKELMDKVNALEYDVKISSKKMDQLNNELEELIRAEQAKNENQTIYSTDGFIWPVSASFKKISTGFGYDAWRRGQHRGLDISGSGSSIAGTKVHAVQSGTVIAVYNGCSHNYGKNYSCGCGGGYGNYIIIDHGGGVSTMYAHIWGVNASAGQHVNQGDVIGYVGSTGWSTGFHLHFEVRVNGVAVNPNNYKYAYYY